MIPALTKMATKSNLGNVNPSKTVFFLCDMQERFRAAIQYFNEITLVSQRLTQTAKILEIPLIVTEQYPKGLGNTVSELDISHAAGVFPKTRFSMVLPEVMSKAVCVDGSQPLHVVLFGIEAHVCVQQTAIDLLEKGIDVHIIADATSSRTQVDRLLAFERLRSAGAIITTSESVMFQLVGDKNHPKFKEVQTLVKTVAPDSGLVPKL